MERSRQCSKPSQGQAQPSFGPGADSAASQQSVRSAGGCKKARMTRDGSDGSFATVAAGSMAAGPSMPSNRPYGAVLEQKGSHGGGSHHAVTASTHNTAERASAAAKPLALPPYSAPLHRQPIAITSQPPTLPLSVGALTPPAQAGGDQGSRGGDVASACEAALEALQASLAPGLTGGVGAGRGSGSGGSSVRAAGEEPAAGDAVAALRRRVGKGKPRGQGSVGPRTVRKRQAVAGGAGAQRFEVTEEEEEAMVGDEQRASPDAVGGGEKCTNALHCGGIRRCLAEGQQGCWLPWSSALA
jgi:hypothetical protein